MKCFLNRSIYQITALLLYTFVFQQRLSAQIEIYILPVPEKDKYDTFTKMEPAARKWLDIKPRDEDSKEQFVFKSCKKSESGSSVIVVYQRTWLNRAGEGGADKPETVKDDPTEETSSIQIETVESLGALAKKAPPAAPVVEAAKPKRPVVKEGADIKPSGNTGTRSFRYVKHKSGLTSVVETGVNERVVEVKADLSVAHLGKGSDVTDAGRQFVTTLGSNSDDAGHVIANRLGGGGGGTVDNLFPQLANVNRGAFAQWEAQIAEWIKDTNNKVSIDIKFNYGQGDSRPISVDYNAIVNGVVRSKHFNN
jgi:hypothetical protein